VYRVRIVERMDEAGGMSDVVGYQTAEEANERARREALDTCAVLSGGWIIARESMAGGLYGARLESPHVAGSIVVMVQRHG